MESLQNVNSSSSNVYDFEMIRDVVFRYLSKWYLFVLSVIICLTIVFVYFKSTNDKYQTQTTILLRKDKGPGGLADLSMLDGLTSIMPNGVNSKEVEDEIQILSSKTLMYNAIINLNLYTEYYQKVGLRYEELFPTSPIRLICPPLFNDTTKDPSVEFNLSSKEGKYLLEIKSKKFTKEFSLVTINSQLNTPYGVFKLVKLGNLESTRYTIKTYSKKNLIDKYCSEIKVASANKKSNTILISTQSITPSKSERIENEMVRLYNMDAVLDKNKIASNTAQFIEERIRIISSELLSQELKVETYKKQNKLTDLSTEAEIYISSSSEYDKQLSEVETQLNLVSFIESYLKDSKNQYSTVPLNMGIKDESMVSVMQDYNKAVLERMRVLRSTNEKNPVVNQMELQLKEMRSNILLTISSVKEGLKISKKDLLGKGKQFDSKIRAVPTQERQFIEIKRQQEIKEKLYLFLLQKREENALSLASTVPSSKTLDEAYTSVKPVTSHAIIYLCGLLFGFIIPIIVLYLLDIVNNKISDKKEYKKLVKAPYLGSIIFSKEPERVVVKEGVTTTIVELIRLVRTNLQFMIGPNKSPVILVTSSISGEGKSFISINLSMSFALTGKKVVVVGLDIRNPMLGEYMHIPREKGVTLFLADTDYTLDNIVVRSGFHPNLDVIPAGPIPPNPSELLMSERLEQLITELKQRYDFIILDSAPVGMVSDTLLINRVVDNTVYVSRQDYTPREMTNLINDVYEGKQLNNVSVVLNGVDEASAGYGHGYGYGYGKKS